jgi:rubrerythrin
MDMNIFEFAMEKEKLSENLYRTLASKATNKGLKNICGMLAEEEKNHYRIVERMSRNAPSEVKESSIPDAAIDIFKKMRQSTEKFDLDISQLQLYQKARDIEKESQSFYLEQAEQIEDAKQKEIFRKLAAEEHKHYVLLQNICDFIAKPQTFLENAEFNHIKDYVEGVF